MKSKHTKGKIRVALKEVNTFDWSYFYEENDSEHVFRVHHNEANISETPANSKLICDAFNVTNETGMTPRELQKSHQELLDALNQLRGIEVWIGDAEMTKHFQNTVYPAITNATKK